MTAMGNEGVDVKITVENITETSRVLYAFEPSLAGKLNSRIIRAINTIRDAAAQRLSLLSEIHASHGGSSLAEDAVAAAAGVKVKRARRGLAGWVIIQQNKTGSIAEFAAQGHSPQGDALVDVLSRHFSRPGRFIWQAADEHRDRVLAEVAGAVEQTTAEANSRFGGIV